MKSNVSNAQAAALWTLANHLGHEWAGYTTAEELLTDGWDAVTSRVNEAMETEHADYSDARSSLPSGIWPARAHTTGTGRISWYARDFGDTLFIEVNRPAPGLSGSNSVVLRLTAKYTCEGWILAGCESMPEMIELRHIQALSMALYNSEDEFYLGEIILQIDDANFVDRISPEIDEAQAALLASEAEYQAQCDAYLLAKDNNDEN